MTVLQCVRSASVTSRQAGGFAGCLPCFLDWITAANGPAPHSAVCSSEWGTGDRGAAGRRGSGASGVQRVRPGISRWDQAVRRQAAQQPPMQANLPRFCFALERATASQPAKGKLESIYGPDCRASQGICLVPARRYPDRLTARPGRPMPTQRKAANRMRNGQSGLLRLQG